MKIPTKNPFADFFQSFTETTTRERLERKFQPLPYWRKFLILRLIALAASYLFNILSAATAATLVYLFTLSILPYHIAATIATLAAIVLLELSKRKTAGEFFKDRLQFAKTSGQLAAVILILTGLSITGSYFGAQRLVKEFHAGPDLIQTDSTAEPIRAQLAAIESQIQEARKTRWKGTTTVNSQRTIETLSKEKLILTERLAAIENNADQDNRQIKTAHAATVNLTAENFALITLVLELLFLLCAYYLQYYDWRSFVELAGIDQVDVDNVPVTALEENSNDATDPEASTAAIHNDHVNNAIVTKLAEEALEHTNGNGNGQVKNEARRQIGFTKHNGPVKDKSKFGNATCENCGKTYQRRTWNQRFCCETCRVQSWEERTGKKGYIAARKKKHFS
jgi:hypothetical protein